MVARYRWRQLLCLVPCQWGVLGLGQQQHRCCVQSSLATVNVISGTSSLEFRPSEIQRPIMLTAAVWCRLGSATAQVGLSANGDCRNCSDCSDQVSAVKQRGKKVWLGPMLHHLLELNASDDGNRFLDVRLRSYYDDIGMAHFTWSSLLLLQRCSGADQGPCFIGCSLSAGSTPGLEQEQARDRYDVDRLERLLRRWSPAHVNS